MLFIVDHSVPHALSHLSLSLSLCLCLIAYPYIYMCETYDFDSQKWKLLNKNEILSGISNIRGIFRCRYAWQQPVLMND